MSVLRSAVTAAAGLALSLTSPALAGGGVSISSYGQRALLIQGGGQSVLLSNPDVLIIGVGGGSKIYNAEEAAAVVKLLNPKRVIPVQYVNGDAPEVCDQEGVQPFLDAMGGTAVRQVGRTQTLPGQLDDTTVITVMQ